MDVGGDGTLEKNVIGSMYIWRYFQYFEYKVLFLCFSQYFFTRAKNTCITFFYKNDDDDRMRMKVHKFFGVGHDG